MGAHLRYRTGTETRKGLLEIADVEFLWRTPNMLRLNTIAVLALIGTASCKSAMLYPVAGPLASESPLPVAKAKISGIMGNSGGTSMTLASGEKCEGRWASIAPMQVSTVSVSMESAWDTVYGRGYAISNVAGVNHGEAMLTCDRGTVLEVEFLTGSGTASGTGVAKDNHGNIYKVLF